jgi:Glycoside-hydrolase family GH114
MNWQWQLTTPVDEKVKAQMYDIDMFDNDATVVSSLHNKGRRVVC